MKKRKKHPIAPRVELQAAALKLQPAAKYLGGLSVPTMHRLILKGELVPVRKVRHLLFTIDELDRFLNKT
jgi:Helix-turn-helix domain